MLCADLLGLGGLARGDWMGNDTRCFQISSLTAKGWKSRQRKKNTPISHITSFAFKKFKIPQTPHQLRVTH